MEMLLPVTLVLALLYAIGWHNQPARDPREESPTNPQGSSKQTRNR